MNQNDNRMQALTERMTAELRSIHELVEKLHIDDVENSVQNAKRCLEGHGYLELQNMVANYYYRAGQNQIINEIREILGLERLYLPGEKEKLDESIKLSGAGSPIEYDCPPLQPHEFAYTDGKAGLITLGEDGDLLVLGTKSIDKALKMMRHYQKTEFSFEGDELVAKSDISEEMIVWRNATYEHEDEYTHMFSWDLNKTRHNDKAVVGFLVRY